MKANNMVATCICTSPDKLIIFRYVIKMLFAFIFPFMISLDKHGRNEYIILPFCAVLTLAISISFLSLWTGVGIYVLVGIFSAYSMWQHRPRDSVVIM